MEKKSDASYFIKNTEFIYYMIGKYIYIYLSLREKRDMFPFCLFYLRALAHL